MGLLTSLFGPPSREDFAGMVAAAIRAQAANAEVSFDAATYSLRIVREQAEDGELLLSLGNFYRVFSQKARGDRQQFVDALVRQHLLSPPPMPKNFADARQRLLPSLRSRCYYPFSRLASEANGMKSAEKAFEPFGLFNERIAIGLVLDYPNTMRVVDAAGLASWGASSAEAVAVATGNLRARTDPSFQPARPGVWASSWEDTYDATRLLLPDVITSVSVRGRHVALAPHRNLLLVTGDEDEAGLLAAAELAAGALDEPQTISTIPMLFDGTSWIDFTLPPEHPAASAFAWLALQMQVSEYDEQQALLEAVAERRNDDAFVAAFTGTKNRETGILSSYTIWGDGFPVLLPRADRVAFVGADTTALGFAAWDEVVRVMGASMVMVEEYPVRYRVERFPGEDQLREMGLG